MNARKGKYLETESLKGLLVAVCFSPMVLLSQEPGLGSPVQVWEKRIAAQRIALDKLGQVYVLAPGNRLLRFGSNGVSTGEFSLPGLGRLAGIDVGDPLSPLLWYPDFQAVVLLDRTLGYLSTLYLPDDVFVFPVLVVRGRDNRIWVFDKFQNRLICIDTHGRPQGQSQELNLGGQSPKDPQVLVADEEGFFLSDSLQGIWRFDRLGQFQVFLPVKKVEAILPIPGRQTIFKKEGDFFLIGGQEQPKPLILPFQGSMLSMQSRITVTWGEGVLRYFRQ